MKNYRLKLGLLIPVIIFGCGQVNEKVKAIKQEYPESLKIMVENPASIARTDAAVFMNLTDIKAKSPDFNANAFVVISGSEELASQADDLDGNGSSDQIVFVANFAPQEKKTITLYYNKEGTRERVYTKRTQAELSVKMGGKFVNREYIGGTFQNVKYLRVPPEHTDHSWYIRYEGPGWESDKVGYRFYLDWRNANDVFGKKTPDMVLQDVGLDGFDSYHEMSDWGMDILKVGESLGIGSIAMWHDGNAERVSVTDSVTCRIAADGPVFSEIETSYYGWKVGDNKYNLVSDLSITAGSRMTKSSLQIEGNPPNLCTGIVKLENTKLLQLEDPAGEWSYLATYGKQSLAEDNLGLAVVYKNADLIEITEDKYSHVVVLKPEQEQLDYYFLAAWDKEPNGITNETAFVSYLKDVITQLDNPLVTNME